VHVTQRAVESFRYHHGGSDTQARLHLHSMLEDFTLQSVHTTVRGGFVVLSRAGYRVVLSPDLNAITGYSTLHQERTWSQVRTGVASRISRRHRRAPKRPPTPGQLEALEPGQSLTGEVISVVPFGIFVDIGGFHGLMHTSTMGLGEGRGPSDVFHPGQVIEVMVCDVDKQARRVALAPTSSAGEAETPATR
jgi:hypothetical protein